MDVNETTGCLSGGLVYEDRKFMMPILHTTLDTTADDLSAGWDPASVDWGVADDTMTQLTYSPNAYLDELSYDYSSGSFAGLNALVGDGTNLSVAETICGLFPPSPLGASAAAGQFPGQRFLSPRAGTSDTDSDYFEQDLSSPTSDAAGFSMESSRKRGLTQSGAQSDFYMAPTVAAVVDNTSPPPLKRACSDASSTLAIPDVTSVAHKSKSKGKKALSSTSCTATDAKSKSRSAATKARKSSRSRTPLGTHATSTSGSGGNHKVQLRTAARKNKSAKSPVSWSSAGGEAGSEQASNDSLTAEERRARQSHNIVEKQYRNRLNSQFERLLAVLPADQRLQDSDDIDGVAQKHGKGPSSTEADDRRMSKADVLGMARRRIKVLEQERRKLRLERDHLMKNVAALRSAIAH